MPMLSNLIANTFRYESIQISNNDWVVRKKKVQVTSKKMYIPDFDFVQKITSYKTDNLIIRQLHCICQYSEVYGLPCVHSLVVTSPFKLKWQNVTHNDISVIKQSVKNDAKTKSYHA